MSVFMQWEMGSGLRAIIEQNFIVVLRVWVVDFVCDFVWEYDFVSYSIFYRRLQRLRGSNSSSPFFYLQYIVSSSAPTEPIGLKFLFWVPYHKWTWLSFMSRMTHDSLSESKSVKKTLLFITFDSLIQFLFTKFVRIVFAFPLINYVLSRYPHYKEGYTVK